MLAEAISTGEVRPASPRLFLLYHELRREPAKYTYATGVGAFREHLALYRELRRAGSGLRPEITFDDGHVSNVELAAPLLASAGIAAHFFVTAAWTATKAGYMDWAGLRELVRDGHTIGSHGWSHTLLTQCTSLQFETELVRPRKVLEDGLGIAVTTMSLPGGRFNRRVLDACRAAGYDRIFTSIPKAAPMTLPFVVGRLNILGNMRTEWLTKVLDPSTGLIDKLERKQLLKDRVKSLLGDPLYARIWAAFNRQESEEAPR